MQTNVMKLVQALVVVVASATISSIPTPALAQVGRPVVQHDTYVQDDPGRAVAGSCVVAGVSNGTTTTVFVTGHALAPGSVATRVRCAIVQAGRVVGSFQNALPGSLAVTGGTATLGPAPYTVCMSLYVAFADGGEARYDGCP